MQNLNQWAIRHGVSALALQELRAMFGTHVTETKVAPGGFNTEADVQNRIRLEASRCGARIWRNNVGACQTAEGQFIRYGLCNDSKQMNAKVKSSDLVGIRPVIILPEHVGQTFGLFIAREVKSPGWRYSGTPREKAQLAFIELVNSLGGNACFANSEGTL